MDAAPDREKQFYSQKNDGLIAGTASSRQEPGILGQIGITPRKKEVNAETPGVLVPQQDHAAKQTQTSDANKQPANSETFNKRVPASATTLARGSVQFSENAPLSLNAHSREGAAAYSKSDANSKPETRNEAINHVKDADRSSIHEYSHLKDENVKPVANKPESFESRVQSNEAKSVISNSINRVDVKDMLAQPISNKFAEGVNQLSVATGKIVDAVKGTLPPDTVNTIVAPAGGASNRISENIAGATETSKQILGHASGLIDGVKNTFANTDAGKVVKVLSDSISTGGTNAVRAWTDATTQGLKGLIDSSITKSNLLPGEGAKGLVSALATIAESVKQNIVGSAAGGKFIWLALAGIADVTKSEKPSGADRRTGAVVADQTKSGPRDEGKAVPDKWADKNKVENKGEGKPSDKKVETIETGILAPDAGRSGKHLAQDDGRKGARIIDKAPPGDKTIKSEDKSANDKTATLVGKPVSTDKTNPVSADGRTNFANNLKNPLDADKTQTASTRFQSQNTDKTSPAGGSAAGGNRGSERAIDPSFDIQRQSKTNWDQSLYVKRITDRLIVRLKNEAAFNAISRDLGSNFRQVIDFQNSRYSDHEKPEIIVHAKDQKPIDTDKVIKKDNLDALAQPLDNTFIEISPLLEGGEKEAKEKIEPIHYESQRRYKLRTNSRTRRQYYVNEGDTLEKIADNFYADKSIAAAIYYLNRSNIPIVVYKGAEYAYLPSNTIIALPNDKQIDTFRQFSKSEIEEIGFGTIPFSSKHEELVFWESRNFAFGKIFTPGGSTDPILKVELLSSNMRIVQFDSGHSDGRLFVSLQRNFLLCNRQRKQLKPNTSGIFRSSTENQSVSTNG